MTNDVGVPRSSTTRELVAAAVGYVAVLLLLSAERCASALLCGVFTGRAESRRVECIWLFSRKDFSSSVKGYLSSIEYYTLVRYSIFIFTVVVRKRICYICSC